MKLFLFLVLIYANVNGYDFSNANGFVDSLISLLSQRNLIQFDSIATADYGPIKIGQWGEYKFHNGEVGGISNMQRSGDIQVSDIGNNKKRLNGQLVISNAWADYKIDMKFVFAESNNNDVHMSADKVYVDVEIEVDLNEKSIMMTDIKLNSIEGSKSRMSGVPPRFNIIKYQFERFHDQIIKFIIDENIKKVLRYTKLKNLDHIIPLLN